jgi:hypothetical protein
MGWSKGWGKPNPYNEGRMGVDGYMNKCSRCFWELQGFWNGDVMDRKRRMGGVS